jgi:uncharacterized protein (DUF3820 family)
LNIDQIPVSSKDVIAFMSGNSDDELTELANTRMPFGKYKDVYLTDLPDAYLVWFSRKGFPDGRLGQMLAAMHEIKINGLEKLLVPLRRS